MADGIESFSESRNLARVKAGYKGGPFYINPVEVPARTFVTGWDPLSLKKLDAASIRQGTPVDVWRDRHARAVK